MTTPPPVNMTTPPVAAVHYAPTTDPETTAFPWLIAAAGEPLTRVAEPDQAVTALQIFPEILAEGWGPAPAMQRAADHADAVSTPPTTRSVAEEPGSGYAVTYAPEDPHTPGRYPWTLLDPQGHPVARTAAGDHALDALQVLPDHLDHADPVAAALDAARVFIWNTYAEEVQP